jgi:hypothetical protein
VALVAALAALAIAGRVAFAAFPNVKPTTDIVIFAGYALGPAAGFAVGALTALVSNFWFGQGPWTPWQMAGWGLCGVLGAALALGLRNAGRLTLAAACGFAGIAYGALLNFSLMATYGGDLSLQHFLLLESRAVPFDAAHAVGNIVFALIAGPAMVRMLVRFRERFEWRTPAVATTLALLAVALVSVPAARASEAGDAAHWLVSVQNADGGFGASPGDSSGPEITGWVMLGLEAAGRNPLDVSRNGNTPVDYLRKHAGDLKSSGDLARSILALEGAGVNPRSFGGRNLVAALANRRREDGSFEGWPGTTAYSVVALRAAGATGGLDKSQSWLVKAQNADGGWGDEPGSPSTADDTGAVMQAIPDTKAAEKGLDYLRKAQRNNGGFPLGGNGEVNSQSTAWAAQGMLAVGADPGSIKAGGKSALDYLAARQESDGHFSYSSSDDRTPVWVTGEALVPVAGDFFPVPVPARAPKPEKQPQPSPAPALAPETPAPATPPAQSPSSGSGAGGSGGSTTGGLPNGLGHAGPLVPGGAPVPTGPATAEEPPAGSEAAPSSSAQSEGDGGSGTSPWAPLGIGLLAATLAVCVPWLLGKRFAW